MVTSKLYIVFILLCHTHPITPEPPWNQTAPELNPPRPPTKNNFSLWYFLLLVLFLLAGTDHMTDTWTSVWKFKEIILISANDFFKIGGAAADTMPAKLRVFYCLFIPLATACSSHRIHKPPHAQGSIAKILKINVYPLNLLINLQIKTTFSFLLRL